MPCGQRTPRDASGMARHLFTVLPSTALPVSIRNATLISGGDFADGVIAHAGYRLGDESFCSFDSAAVQLLTAQGHRAKRL